MISHVVKRLSANDVGDTGGHQAGILVPRDAKVLSFFPQLDASEKNPRAEFVVRELDSGDVWRFMYIYYNNRFFGGTRNEYRLTHMTAFLRAVNAKAGDEVRFSLDEDRSYRVQLERAANARVDEEAPSYEAGVLVLSGGWKVINF